jgi:hypothetical protein
MTMTRKIVSVTGVLLALTLGGCWDDNSNDAPPAPPSNTVPDSADASTAAFVGYIVTLSGTDESSEPLLINNTFVVPPDETSEPTPLT